jgi:hypothetical protein
MTFKKWLQLQELVYPGVPERERPDLLATAMPTVNRKENPPKTGDSPLAKYDPMKAMDEKKKRLQSKSSSSSSSSS